MRVQEDFMTFEESPARRGDRLGVRGVSGNRKLSNIPEETKEEKTGAKASGAGDSNIGDNVEPTGVFELAT